MYKGTADALIRIAREEGISGLYRCKEFLPYHVQIGMTSRELHVSVDPVAGFAGQPGCLTFA